MDCLGLGPRVGMDWGPSAFSFPRLDGTFAENVEAFSKDVGRRVHVSERPDLACWLVKLPAQKSLFVFKEVLEQNCVCDGCRIIGAMALEGWQRKHTEDVWRWARMAPVLGAMLCWTADSAAPRVALTSIFLPCRMGRASRQRRNLPFYCSQRGTRPWHDPGVCTLSLN